MFTHFLRKYESSEEATGKKKAEIFVEANAGRSRKWSGQAETAALS